MIESLPLPATDIWEDADCDFCQRSGRRVIRFALLGMQWNDHYCRDCLGRLCEAMDQEANVEPEDRSAAITTSSQTFDQMLDAHGMKR